MAWLKTLFGKLKGLSPTTIAIIAGAAVALVLLFLLVRWLFRRKRAKAAAAAPAAAGSGATPQRLMRIWREFLRQIPREFRRAVLHYQPFVVLGESGAGKTQLIDQYTDWKGQAAQFFPSYAADPTLQIYLGSKALIQEMPAPLLRDTSRSARAALLRLWRTTFRERDPVAVVAVNAGALRNMSPAELRMQAQMIRGKINVISQLRKRPVKTRIVLTHMDLVEGYLAFSQFLEKQNIPLRLEIGPDGSTEACLEPYEKYLSLALTTLQAKAYLKALTFLTKAPQTLAYLQILIKTLRETDPLSFEPEIAEIYMTSNTAGGPSSISNPLGSSWAGAARRGWTRRARHHAAAAAVGLVGFVYLALGYGIERREWQRAADLVARFEAAGEAQDASVFEDHLAGIERRAATWPRRLFPSFFDGPAEEIKERYAAAMRRHHLLPALDRVAGAPNPHEAALYLLGLICAARGTQLGEYVVAHRVEWSRALGIPDHMVRAYVECSARPYAEPIQVRTLPVDRRPTGQAELELWLAFLLELEDAFEATQLSPSQLASLQDSATRLFDSLARAGRHDASRAVYGLLNWTLIGGRDQFGTYLEETRTPEWILKNARRLEGLLEMIRSASLAVDSLRDVELGELLYRIEGAGLTTKESDVFSFELSNRSFVFPARRWAEIVERARLRVMVREFISLRRDERESIFFSKHASYPDIRMQPATSGDFLFAGRGTIAGRCTRAAFEKEVRPVLEAFGPFLERLNADADVKSQLAAFVLQEADRYAVEYEKQCAAYFDAWTVKADSLASAMIVLDRMRQPASLFKQLLETIADNTRLGEVGSYYLRPMGERLAKYEPLNRLILVEKGGFPELDKYAALLERLRADLAGTPFDDEGKKLREPEKGEGAALASTTATGAAQAPAPAPKPRPDEAPRGLEDDLTAAGKVSLAILRESRDSYLRAVSAWLDSAGISARWRKPFLEPVLAVHQLGLADMEAAVKKGWETRAWPIAAPLLTRFPFNRAAIRDVTPLELEEAIHPTTGTFWRVFRAAIGPACVEERGQWRPLPALETGFAWPPKMFEIVNRLSRLAETLWEKNGQPRPIELAAQNHPLPKALPGKRAIVLAYLGTGKASAFAFNQKPTWQPLVWEWWTPQVAQVGLEIGEPDDEQRATRAIVEAEALWSFLRLLHKAQVLERNVWTWTLPRGDIDYPAPAVRFALRENPWDLFKVPTPEEVANAQGN